MKVEIHDSRGHPARVQIVELEALPRIGETFCWDENVGGATVKNILHTPGRPPQVRCW